MTEQESTSPHTEYYVVMRAASGFHFGELEEAFVIESYPTPIGRADFVFASRYTNVKEFQRPVRSGLRVDARGVAASISEAADAFANAARGLAAIVSFCTNIECEDLQIEMIFDVTPGKTEREYFQQFLPADQWMRHSGRPTPVVAVNEVIRAVATHAEAERLQRAIAHYHHALQNWEPGSEIFALAHLYMGIEALTPVALGQQLARDGITKEELAKQWGIDWDDEKQRKSFDPEVRRRVLFGGDTAAYQAARKASDAYEHSFESMENVRTMAIAARERTADYLRRAVLDLAGIDQPTQDVLLAPPYATPQFWSITKYLRGTIVGAGDNLAAPDQAYPYVVWKSKIREPEQTGGPFEVQYDETISPRLAEGLTFRVNRLEFWGPSPETTTVEVEQKEDET